MLLATFLAHVAQARRIRPTTQNPQLPVTKYDPGLTFGFSDVWNGVNRTAEDIPVHESYQLVDMDASYQGPRNAYCTGASWCTVVVLYHTGTGRHFLSHISAASQDVNGAGILDDLTAFLDNTAHRVMEDVRCYLFSQTLDGETQSLGDVIGLFSAAMSDAEITRLAANTWLVTGANGYRWNVYWSVRVNLGKIYVNVTLDTPE